MKTATITTESGYTWKTSINGTDESIFKYFLGERFDVGEYPVEKMEKVTAVTITKKVPRRIDPKIFLRL
jgi:hypothetical protein|tara:strand:- start:239 stop:445 length:207 start_codon:yes stop_codon:yes gene_type:complete